MVKISSMQPNVQLQVESPDDPPKKKAKKDKQLKHELKRMNSATKMREKDITVNFHKLLRDGIINYYKNEAYRIYYGLDKIEKEWYNKQLESSLEKLEKHRTISVEEAAKKYGIPEDVLTSMAGGDTLNVPENKPNLDILF